jgi:hypothetical protein
LENEEFFEDFFFLNQLPIRNVCLQSYEFLNIQMVFDEKTIYIGIWQYGLWSFQTGDTKLERFLPKNQLTQRNYWILSFGLMASCQKVPEFDFQGQLSMSKIIRIFLNFFPLKNTNLGAHFLFWNNHFLIIFITKMMPYFSQLAITPKHKIQ